MNELPLDEAQRLIAAIVDLAGMADRALPSRGNDLGQRLRDHLGVGDVIPNTSVSLAPIEHANLQVALDALRAEAETWEEIGLAADVGNYGGVSLPALISGTWHGPGETARQFVSVEVSPTETIRCLRAGVVLATVGGVPSAIMMYASERHMPELLVEVAANTQDAADDVLRRLRDLMATNNVLRGKVLTFAFGEYGHFGMKFTTVPHVERDDVILPAAHLDAIDEHALGITAVGDELLAAGQHLKRGLLLYGPPGTGKTHTVSYLVGRMAGRTTIILSGASVGAVGQAGTLARKLAPATIVIEDVDLIGMDRGLPGGEHNPLLFQLLNEMDGLQADDDVLFVLTTNRADLLEPALAARPGRVDQAIEIGLPDADGRRALFGLYLREHPGDALDAETLAAAVARTEGAAAAFIKELARRTTLNALRTGVSLTEAMHATMEHIDATATPLLRASLAAHRTDAEPAP